MKTKKNELILVFISILMCGISLAYYWCMIDCPYRGDDWLNANSGLGTIYYSGETIGELTLRICKAWIENGRFFPFSSYTYYLFAIFNTLHSYRIFLFCITLIMVLLSGLVIKKLTNNYQMTASFIVLTPMMFYLSEYDSCNPLLCYHGLIQMTVILLMSSMLFLMMWIDKNKCIYAIMSTVFYFMGLCMYEVSYVFIVFIAFAVLYRESNIKNAIKKMTPVLTSLVLALLINVIVRIISSGGGYAGVSISFSISKIVSTALCMMAAAFPVYNAFATGNTFESSDISNGDVILSIIIALLFVLTFYIFNDKESKKRERIITYCMGFSLWILPAFLIGLSAKYQNQIRWGTAWLPYFAEVIGTSIILVQLCRDFYRTVSCSTCWKWMKHVISLVLFVIIGFMTLWNRTAGAHSYSAFEMQGFYTITDALESGIMDEISDKDIIHVIPTVGSENEPNIFYSRFAQKKCNADILNSEQYLTMDYSIYEKEYTAKKIDLGDGNNIFVVGFTNPEALDTVSYPSVFIPENDVNISISFLVKCENTENNVIIDCAHILKTSNDKGIIIQIPYENVIVDSIIHCDN